MFVIESVIFETMDYTTFNFIKMTEKNFFIEMDSRQGRHTEEDEFTVTIIKIDKNILNCYHMNCFAIFL